jgi:hypothetical protein
MWKIDSSAGGPGSVGAARAPRTGHLLLLLEDLLPELELRLLPLALGLLLLLLELLLLPPLEAEPRLLPELLREEDEPDLDEPDFEEAEELRDAMAAPWVG